MRAVNFFWPKEHAWLDQKWRDALERRSVSDFEKNIKWVVAIDSSHYGNDARLLALLAGEEHIPTELRPSIAAALSGRRKKRNASKSKIPAHQRLLYACIVSGGLDFFDRLKKLTSDEGERFIEHCADYQGCEPRDIVRIIESSASDWINRAATIFEISPETVENLLRDLRKKMANYPNV